MSTYQTYLARLRNGLIEVLDQPGDWSERQDLVERMLNEWNRLYCCCEDLPDTTLQERLCWYTLYLLEDLSEYFLETCEHDDWIALQLGNLDILKVLLKSGAGLPEGCWATRPNGDSIDSIDSISEDERPGQ